ncbi:LytTR family DNA-binding domain-containing protein [Mucilaginibacter sp. cycad4]|uniref:LytR/AlgR family response regulator transcription factor n=1 Tax=Mucilaginibacter sp. cycad4 TaxID=3342096 RepID=UPI002AAC4C5D|nr:LytTR family DNA-binding domain-containing protein [Mucilaginibacter gossypii]WPV00633.1 LytTR family DNA-binding domain-containing protein [Mucilaginibacter gossypii]
MNIAIIEDEPLVADDLELSITQLVSEPATIVQLHSVKEAIGYFTGGNKTDLIFSDIQLGDGLSFEIFAAIAIDVPVIFCTAYDEYALDAFKANGIDYILKPFTTQTLQQALERYAQLKKVFLTKQPPQYDMLLELLAKKETPRPSSVLVYHQDKIIPIKLDDIALIYLSNEVTHLLTFSGKKFYPNKNLDELERTCGSYFFRANRQFLVSRKAIIDVSSFFSRKLSLNLNITFSEKVVVSKGKASQFLAWLAKA